MKKTANLKPWKGDFQIITFYKCLPREVETLYDSQNKDSV